MKTEHEDKSVVQPLFEGVDCVHVRVDSLSHGLVFYQEVLGLKLLWRTNSACGLGMQTGVTELVLSTDDLLMVDFKVENVEKALSRFVNAGGMVKEGPFDIDIGKCAVVADPWGNEYCVLDTSKGTYDTTDKNVVVGVSKKSIDI